eukprot:CAMPEP_0194175256 /NCGR_PEP_ID=MMETSP0154-20130528/9306_1 /TAXON_ID=1049557 /ORGANISM="Thalassiothrix antarctica, Strain L6-D1" /LENGTH=417 /DNA_ID=CAMNT_0038888981 /DNA_START=53 /DNA_END=1306 /DNA_ORIENTATION=+
MFNNSCKLPFEKKSATEIVESELNLNTTHALIARMNESNAQFLQLTAHNERKLGVHSRKRRRIDDPQTSQLEMLQAEIMKSNRLNYLRQSFGNQLIPCQTSMLHQASFPTPALSENTFMHNSMNERFLNNEIISYTSIPLMHQLPVALGSLSQATTSNKGQLQLEELLMIRQQEQLKQLLSHQILMSPENIALENLRYYANNVNRLAERSLISPGCVPITETFPHVARGKKGDNNCDIRKSESHNSYNYNDSKEKTTNIDSSKFWTHTLYLSRDKADLSRYQCLVRKQLEFFEAKDEDVKHRMKGYGKEIVSKQVGIQCRHCSQILTRHRTRGATGYPTKLDRIYHTAQSMASGHLSNNCPLIPDVIQQKLIKLQKKGSVVAVAGGQKKYWAEAAKVLGIVQSENDGGLLHIPVPKS